LVQPAITHGAILEGNMTVQIALLCKMPLLARAIARVIECGGAKTLTISSSDPLEERLVESSPQLLCMDEEFLPRVLPLLGQHCEFFCYLEAGPIFIWKPCLKIPR